jgi:hypothetical protein
VILDGEYGRKRNILIEIAPEVPEEIDHLQDHHEKEQGYKKNRYTVP